MLPTCLEFVDSGGAASALTLRGCHPLQLTMSSTQS